MAPKVKGVAGARKPLENGNEEAVVSSTSGSLNGEDELAAVAVKATTVGRKGKKEAAVAKKEKEQRKLPEKDTATGRGRGRKKAATAEISVEPVLVEERVLEEIVKPAAAKGRGKKLAAVNGDNKATQNAEELGKSEKVEKVSAKKGRKATAVAVVAEETNQAELAVAQQLEKVVKAPAKRGRRAITVDVIAEPVNAPKAPAKGRSRKQTAAAAELDVAAVEDEVLPAKVAPNKKRTTKKLVQEVEVQLETKDDAVEKSLAKETKKKKGKAAATTAAKEDELAEDLEIKAEEKPAKTANKRKAAKELEAATSTVEIVQPADDEANNIKKKAKKPEITDEKKSKTSSRSKKVTPPQEQNVEEEFENGIEKEKKPRGRKRALAEEDDAADDVDGAKPTKTKKTAGAPLNPTSTKYNKTDFKLAPTTDGDVRHNLKISSWNVAGLRSWLKKDGLQFLEYEEPDIFCLQEIKCTIDQMPDEVARIPGYHPYWLCMPGGYAGVAIYSKIMPIHVEYGIGDDEFDNVGRMITAEYEKFYLINVYVPNSGRKLVNLEPRMRWEKLFQAYVQRLDALKPVIICGDMNVSHLEIDLANPKTNTRNAGFTKEERDKMTELLALGYVDTFRHLYPTRTGAYTFWTYMGNARTRNVGWRLDYFIVSERIIKRVVDNCMRTQVMGSDHCPTTLFLKI